jgi:hypothetical protein
MKQNRKDNKMETIIYKSWNITNAYNEKGIEYWTIWTPDCQDLVSEDFKTISLAKKWVDERVKQTEWAIKCN